MRIHPETAEFLKAMEPVIKRGYWYEFYLSAYQDTTSAVCNQLEQVVFPNLFNKMPEEQRISISEKMREQKLAVMEYILLRAVEQWKEDGCEQLSKGAFIRTYIHNYLGSMERLWISIFRDNSDDLGVILELDNYGVEMVLPKEI
jgi:hypothetical protein